MAIALVTNTGKGSTDNYNVTTSSVDTTGANLIVLATGNYAPGSQPTVSDSKGNSWTVINTYTAILSRVKMWYCLNPTVGSGHTFTASTSGAAPAICVSAFSGVKASSAYEAETGSNVAPGTSLQPGSITPAEDNEVQVTALAISAVETLSINSSFSITDQIALVAGKNYGLGMAYRIQTTATAVNPTWSWSASRYSAACMSTYKYEPPSGHPAIRRLGLNRANSVNEIGREGVLVI